MRGVEGRRGWWLALTPCRFNHNHHESRDVYQVLFKWLGLSGGLTPLDAGQLSKQEGGKVDVGMSSCGQRLGNWGWVSLSHGFVEGI